jgi:hypothetical protein
MRQIKGKERKAAGNLYCSFCRPEKVDAIYRRRSHASHDNGYACENHKEKIEPKPESDHMTEADYQTWDRL